MHGLDAKAGMPGTRGYVPGVLLLDCRLVSLSQTGNIPIAVADITKQEK